LVCSELVLDEFDEEDDKEEGEFSSDSDDDAKSKRAAQKSRRTSDKTPIRSQLLDFSKLPILHNGGLNYLPKMQYFNVGIECPVKPANKLPSDESLTVIIHLPNGGFKCIAIPLEAVEEDEKE
jgi:hypothetical protein